MDIISDSLEDIERKLKILNIEKMRLIKERKQELSIDPYRISSIDYSRSITKLSSKHDMKVRDDEYIKVLDGKISELDIRISELETIKKEYIDILSKMDGIEYRIFSYLLKGYRPTRAINKVGEENYLNGIKPTTRNGLQPYYDNVKKICKLG